ALNQKCDRQNMSLKKTIAWGAEVMDNLIEVGLRALGRGCELSLEPPAKATSWKTAQSLMNFREQLCEVTAAGCAWGMRGREPGQAACNNWRSPVPNQRAAEVLGRKCPRDHERRQLDGSKRAADSARYPEALCRALSREVLVRALVTGITAGASEIEGAPRELTQGHPEQAEAMTIKNDAETEGPTGELRKSVRLKLHRLHSQLGHPGARAFKEFLLP
ncbi:unnamed protein product, partial [Prorocentrum cordatum]